jgi:RNA polymerase sigma-70 factor (ECF subfamily)
MDDALEVELIARARNGDEQALSELFEARRARLVRMVELRIDPSLKRRLDPADVVQEAWLDLARRLPEWCAQESLPFSIWVRLMTSRALVDAQRRHLAAHKRDALREVPLGETRTNISAVCCAEAFFASNTSPTRAVVRDEIRARDYRARGARRHRPRDRGVASLRRTLERRGGGRALDRARGGEQALRARAPSIAARAVITSRTA